LAVHVAAGDVTGVKTELDEKGGRRSVGICWRKQTPAWGFVLAGNSGNGKIIRGTGDVLSDPGALRLGGIANKGSGGLGKKTLPVVWGALDS